MHEFLMNIAENFGLRLDHLAVASEVAGEVLAESRESAIKYLNDHGRAESLKARNSG